MTDRLLHEVATCLRDLSYAVALYEGHRTEDRLRTVIAGADAAQEVLDKVVDREGDIIPTPPGGPDRWIG